MNVFTQVGQAPNIETNVLKSMMMDVLMKWMMLMLSILWGENLILPSLVTVTTSQKGKHNFIFYFTLEIIISNFSNIK